MSKATPGPWRISKHERPKIGGRMEPCFAIEAVPNSRNWPVRIATLSRDREGDARLIAAAPALRDALLVMLEVADGSATRSWNEARDIARAALRAAEWEGKS